MCRVARFELEYDYMHLHQDLPASSGQWLQRQDLLNFIATLYEGDLHAKRVLSLANATLGVLTSASLVPVGIGPTAADVAPLHQCGEVLVGDVPNAVGFELM